MAETTSVTEDTVKSTLEATYLGGARRVPAALSREEQILVLMLRAGVELHATEPQHGAVYNTLNAWGRHLYGIDESARSMERLERLVRDEPFPQEAVEDLAVEEQILFALALVWFAVADTEVSLAEQQFLSRVLSLLADATGLTVSDLQDWLVGSWPQERFDGFDKVVSGWCESENDAIARIASQVMAYAQQHRTVHASRADFHAMRVQLDARLGEIEGLAQSLGDSYGRKIGTARAAIDQLRRLRIAVLGEFKRGKSTLINALLERPDFMPTDTLPSTSAIIEINSGAPDQYEQLVDLEAGRYEERSRDGFLRQAGNADELSRRFASGEATEALGMPRWRVRTESDFLDGAERITVVDTPGLNEDPIRDRLAREEARRAHAAILVLSASQLLSNYERGLMELLANKIRGLVVVINRIDEVGEEAYPRLLGRVMDHTKGLGLQEDQVMPLNAKQVESEIAQGASAPIDGLERLHDRVTDVALRNIMPLRITSLKETLRTLKQEVFSMLDNQEAELVKEAGKLGEEQEARKTKRAAANREILDLKSDMRTRGQFIAREVHEDLVESWPRILSAVSEKRTEWETDANPLFKPKAAAMEIAKKAEEELVRNVEGWAECTFREKVQPELEAAIEENGEAMASVAEYLHDLTGVDKDEARERLLTEAVKDLLGDDVEIGNVGGAWMSVVAAAVSALVGYAVADVVLFYVLSVIAGFLNPFLLAAAVLAGAALFLLGGREAVMRFMRKKTADKVVEKLGEDSVRDKIAKGVASKTQAIFYDLGDAFQDAAKSFLDEADRHIQETIALASASEEQQEAFRANAERFRDELGRVEAAANSIEA